MARYCTLPRPAILELLSQATRRSKTQMICPQCSENRVHRSRRKGFVEQFVLSAAGVYPYRCSSCKNRFMKRRDPSQSARRSLWSDPPPWLSALLWGIVAVAIALVIVGVVAQRASLK